MNYMEVHLFRDLVLLKADWCYDKEVSPNLQTPPNVNW